MSCSQIFKFLKIKLVFNFKFQFVLFKKNYSLYFKHWYIKPNLIYLRILYELFFKKIV